MFNRSLSIWNRTRFGVFQGEIEFPVYFFLSLNVNLLRLNSVPLRPSPSPHRRRNNKHLVLAAVLFIVRAIIIFTLSHTGHIKITKCPIIATERQKAAEELSCRYLDRKAVGSSCRCSIARGLPPSPQENNNNLLLSFSLPPRSLWRCLLNFNQTFKRFYRFHSIDMLPELLESWLG